MPTVAARAEARPESRWRTPGSKHRAADARSGAPRSPAALRPGGATVPPHQQAPAQRTRARRRGSARASAPRSRRLAPAGAAAGACPRARVGRPASDPSLAGVAAAARTPGPATAAATSCVSCGSAAARARPPEPRAADFASTSSPIRKSSATAVSRSPSRIASASARSTPPVFAAQKRVPPGGGERLPKYADLQGASYGSDGTRTRDLRRDGQVLPLPL
jgi:hypothetical protein